MTQPISPLHVDCGAFLEQGAPLAPAFHKPTTQPKYQLWQPVRVIAECEDFTFNASGLIVGVTWTDGYTLIDGWWYHIYYTEDYPQGCVKQGYVELAHHEDFQSPLVWPPPFFWVNQVVEHGVRLVTLPRRGGG